MDCFGVCLFCLFLSQEISTASLALIDDIPSLYQTCISTIHLKRVLRRFWLTGWFLCLASQGKGKTSWLRWMAEWATRWLGHLDVSQFPASESRLGSAIEGKRRKRGNTREAPFVLLFSVVLWGRGARLKHRQKGGKWTDLCLNQIQIIRMCCLAV